MTVDTGINASSTDRKCHKNERGIHCSSYTETTPDAIRDAHGCVLECEHTATPSNLRLQKSKDRLGCSITQIFHTSITHDNSLLDFTCLVDEMHVTSTTYIEIVVHSPRSQVNHHYKVRTGCRGKKKSSQTNFPALQPLNP